MMNMTAEETVAISKMAAGMALFLSALGSGFGAGAASLAAIGAWKKCYAQNRAASFLLVVFIGAPLSQTIYGMILQGWILAAAKTGALPLGMLSAGILGGTAIGLSAWLQGRAGAAGADALAETGQGFGNYLMALGVIETVAIFVLIFIRSVLA
jgi:V/A-type H+/Na+-transporting ATPase subunit K